MNKFQKRVIAIVAGVGMLVNSVLPVLAITTIQISGNGAGSDNSTQVISTNTTTINQSNTAKITNDIDSSAKTGGNDANFNTGGSVTVDTGDAKVTSNVSTSVNSNAAKVECCGTGDTDVLIQGNGADSNNQVNPLFLANTVTVKQTNDATVLNEVEGKAKTGYNDANSNTGGDVTITTGKAEVDTGIVNKANANSAEIGGGSALLTPTASFRILDNGAGSVNWISAVLTNSTSVTQGNKASITNDVDASAKTGYNDANFNTGGDVTIDTGDAKADTDVANTANFNYGLADCGCLMNVLAKIDGNGAGAKPGDKDDNGIVLTLANYRVFGQTNGATIGNEMNDLFAKTGYNEVDSNTGSSDDPGDPSVLTGNATITNDVSNTANMSVIGGVLPLPEGWPFGGISASFDWVAFMAFFGIHIG